MKLIKTNLNPLNKSNACDCVVRAIAGFTGLSWDNVYKDLCAVGFKLKVMPNSRIAFTKYLEGEGFIKNPMPRFPDNTKYTLKEFIAANPDLKAIVSLANHITFINKGALIDIWDCSYKSVGNYYTRGVNK